MSIRTASQARHLRLGITIGRLVVRRNWHPSPEVIGRLVPNRLERRAFDRHVAHALNTRRPA